MFWKYFKKGLIVILILGIFIPLCLYLNAIDWSKKHSSRVAALPYFNHSADEGEFRLKANNLEFLIRVTGMQNEGPGVIFLHGFPESSLMWQPLLEKAAANGYRAIAFDQRGYSPQARPSNVATYQIDSLVQDVLEVANILGLDTFHLVGHDWGAGVGWKTVMDYPERIHTWTAMSIPHSAIFFNALKNHPEQQKRSAYMKRLQMPFIPEFLFLLNQNKAVEGLKGRWNPKEIKECLAIQKEHGALTGALNWYRANNYEDANLLDFDKVIKCPTLFIWGKQDPVVAQEIIPLQEKYMKGKYKVLSLESGHSIFQAKTDSVTQAILNHFEN